MEGHNQENEHLLDVARSVAEEYDWGVGETDGGHVLITLTFGEKQQKESSYCVEIYFDTGNRILHAQCLVPVARPIRKVDVARSITKHVNDELLQVGRFVLYKDKGGVVPAHRFEQLLITEEIPDILIIRLVYACAAMADCYHPLFGQIDEVGDVEELGALAELALMPTEGGIN